MVPPPLIPCPWGREGKPTYPDACVPLSLGHANVSISLYHSSLRLAQGAQIVHFVIHILGREGESSLGTILSTKVPVLSSSPTPRRSRGL